jgi:hypothetical protein
MGSDEVIRMHQTPRTFISTTASIADSYAPPITTGSTEKPVVAGSPFSTPFKMRKFSDDSHFDVQTEQQRVWSDPTNDKSVTKSHSLLTTAVQLSPIGASSGSKAGSSHEDGTTKATANDGAVEEGIPIPAFMQPLLGMQFVPFVMPSVIVDETTMSTIGEALTDRLLNELDLGCPYSPTGRSDLEETTIASRDVTRSVMGVDNPDRPPAVNSLGRKLLITDSEHERSTNKVANEDHEQFEVQNTNVALSTKTTLGSGKRHRGIGYRRKPRSVNHLSSADDAVNTDSGDPKPINNGKSSRRKMTFRFLKNRKGENDGHDVVRRRSSWSGEDLIIDEDKDEEMLKKGIAAVAVGAPVSCNAKELDWLQEQQSVLMEHQSRLKEVQTNAVTMQQKSTEIADRVKKLQEEISRLQQAMQDAQIQMDEELNNYRASQEEFLQLQRLAFDASQALADSISRMQQDAPYMMSLPATPVRANTVQKCDSMTFEPAPRPPRERASTAPTYSDSFTDANDMRLDWYSSNSGSFATSSSSESITLDTLPSANEFVFVDHRIASVLRNLDQLGYDVATDESDRFIPTYETEKLLRKYRKNQVVLGNNGTWTVNPWHAVHGDDVLIWTGEVKHDGLGSEWPVCKCRGLVQTSPRNLLEYLMDSSKVKEYNKMSLGREDLYFIQKGIDTKAIDSPYGIAGVCKIVKATNKPRLLPITIEMISLMHCLQINDDESYMMVYRSVFEDNTRTGDAAPVIRSEMLLGVLLVRPYDSDRQITEMTSITHMYSPGVPEMIARRAAPSAAMNMLKDIQSIFKRK